MPHGVIVGGSSGKRVGTLKNELVQGVQGLPGIVHHLDRITVLIDSFIQKVNLEVVVHHALVVRLAIGFDCRRVIVIG